MAPLYSYKCEVCGAEFDVLQKMSDAPLTVCEVGACAGKVNKQLSRTAPPKFKGAGFYAVDYNTREGGKK